AGGDEGQPGEDVALVHAAGVGREHGRGVRGHVAYGEGREREVEVTAAGGVHGREDHAGMAGGLVEIRVNADHEVEPGERLVEAGAVRCGECGVAGDGDERPNLARPRGGDLLGEHHHGEFALDLGHPAHAAVPAAGAEAAVLRVPYRCLVGGEREHHPTRAVQVSGEDVDDVDQPGRQGAKLHSGGAEPAVHRGGWRAGDLSSQSTDAIGLDATGVGDPVRVEVLHQRLDLRDA